MGKNCVQIVRMAIIILMANVYCVIINMPHDQIPANVIHALMAISLMKLNALQIFQYDQLYQMEFVNLVQVTVQLIKFLMNAQMI